ncbi:ImmA/IrrE family metallo-endopeptidase [Glycocaulis sp.]|uniref:ImmA/IrrE family metallo-endopeptidase n=1 Tax=Glycocaulis sp. TaxID=1969725 RepID=UPI003D212B4A
MRHTIILNERELRDAKARLERLAEALSSKKALQQAAIGLPHSVMISVVNAVRAEREALSSAIRAYEAAKENKDAALLESYIGGEAGLTLIVARIAKGYSQRDLAWRLGLKEQQIQRYESEKYRSISLKNYVRIATLLGVRLRASIEKNPELRGLDWVISDVSKADIKKIIKHGRESGWFDGDITESKLQQYIAENRIEYGSPSLLRTGLKASDHSEDVLLHAWRARVGTVAREKLPSLEGKFDITDIEWLPKFAHLSQYADGPLRAVQALNERGILLITERQVPGLSIDGAAFIEDGVPVIGLTLRRDSIDNFWFTLMHELGHVILHYSTGLAVGFFDEMDAESTDVQEREADHFASNLLIADEVWRRSTARIASDSGVIEAFASKMNIHPAIVFGRIRMERNNYKIFNDKIGRGSVRSLFST